MRRILNYSTDKRYLDWSNSQGEEVEWWVPGAGGVGATGVQVV